MVTYSRMLSIVFDAAASTFTTAVGFIIIPQWILAIKSSALPLPFIGESRTAATPFRPKTCSPDTSSDSATINESNVLFNLFHYKLPVSLLLVLCVFEYIYIPFRGITRERALSLYLCCFCKMRCQKASRTKRKETNCLRRALASILLAEWTCAEAVLFNWPQASRKFYGGVLWESAFADGWLKCMTIGWLI